MRKLFYAIGAIFTLIMTAGVLTSFAYPAQWSEVVASVRPVHRVPLSSSVEVVLDSGIGSGVHIGDGFFLTAAHVVAGKPGQPPSKTLNLKFSDKSIRPATVLWSSKDYDIALLSADGAGLERARINCAAVTVGEAITSIGNPLGIEAIQASGHVAGEARAAGDVKSAFVMDMTIVMGQSGGAVFNAAGEIVGINSMVMVAPLKVPNANPLAPDVYTPSLVGYGYAVPSSVICKLLARSE